MPSLFLPEKSVFELLLIKSLTRQAPLISQLSAIKFTIKHEDEEVVRIENNAH